MRARFWCAGVFPARFPPEVEQTYREHKAVGQKRVAFNCAMIAIVAIASITISDGGWLVFKLQGNEPNYEAIYANGVQYVLKLNFMWIYLCLLYACYRTCPRWMASNADLMWMFYGLVSSIFWSITPDRWYATQGISYATILSSMYDGGAYSRWTCPTVPGGCASAERSMPCFSTTYEGVYSLVRVAVASALAVYSRMSSDLFFFLIMIMWGVHVACALALGTPTESNPDKWIEDIIMYLAVLLILFLGCRRTDAALRADFIKLHVANTTMKELKTELRKLQELDVGFDEITIVQGSRVRTQKQTSPARGFSTKAILPAAKTAKQQAASRRHPGLTISEKARPFMPVAVSEMGHLIPNILVLPLSTDATAHHASPGDAIRKLLPAEIFEDSGASARQAALVQCASRMREPSYTLMDFLIECMECLPELALYVSTGAPAAAAAGDGGKPDLNAATSSGRSGLDEYLRTIGALSTLFWLSRLELPQVANSKGLDGQLGLCFGIDRMSARPPRARELSQLTSADTWYDPGIAKRLQFWKGAHWDGMHALMIDAGVLESDGKGGVSINAPRMAAMLALTAVHDIMKMTHLCPTVAPRHAPFHGTNAGETIQDHDLALAYVLTHDVGALPCVASLPEADQAAIRFTQADLSFNHGWLVQAEAPPGTIFRQFKRLLESNPGAVRAADIAFYFVHWFTDLAGAEPTPFRGSEKFVMQFPQPVLGTLIASMPFVQKLVDTTPTDLYEQYLHFASARDVAVEKLPPTRGEEGIALMRLLIQCQDEKKQRLLQAGFARMPGDKRRALSYELALTGVAGEAFTTASHCCAGPAVLIYYMPAFVRNCCALKSQEEAEFALAVLCEVLRATRELWPRDTSDAACSSVVTVMINELKERASREAVFNEYTHGRCWVLQRKSELNGAVQLTALRELPDLMAAGGCVLLQLWKGGSVDVQNGPVVV